MISQIYGKTLCVQTEATERSYDENITIGLSVLAFFSFSQWKIQQFHENEYD